MRASPSSPTGTGGPTRRTSRRSARRCCSGTASGGRIPGCPIPEPVAGASGRQTPLRDISASGLRYALTRFESAPAIGSRIEGALQLDAETSIEVRGRVVRLVGREIAVEFDPPGLDQSVLDFLQRRFFPG